MMNPAIPGVVMGGYVMGPEGYVMGAAPPVLHAAPHHHVTHPQHNVAHLPAVHIPPWIARGMIAPGMPVPSENRKILPVAPLTQGGTFAAVTDRITYSARPQKRFLGERPVFTIVKIGDNAQASAVLCNLFAVGTNPQQVELGAFGVEDFTGNSLDMNLAMDQCEPGVEIRFDLSLVGPAFVDGEDSVFVSIKILGRSVG